MFTKMKCVHKLASFRSCSFKPGEMLCLILLPSWPIMCDIFPQNLKALAAPVNVGVMGLILTKLYFLKGLADYGWHYSRSLWCNSSIGCGGWDIWLWGLVVIAFLRKWMPWNLEKKYLLWRPSWLSMDALGCTSSTSEWVMGGGRFNCGRERCRLGARWKQVWLLFSRYGPAGINIHDWFITDWWHWQDPANSSTHIFSVEPHIHKINLKLPRIWAQI